MQVGRFLWIALVKSSVQNIEAVVDVAVISGGQAKSLFEESDEQHFEMAFLSRVELILVQFIRR